MLFYANGEKRGQHTSTQTFYSHDVTSQHPFTDFWREKDKVISWIKSAHEKLSRVNITEREREKTSGTHRGSAPCAAGESQRLRAEAKSIWLILDARVSSLPLLLLLLLLLLHPPSLSLSQSHPLSLSLLLFPCLSLSLGETDRKREGEGRRGEGEVGRKGGG